MSDPPARAPNAQFPVRSPNNLPVQRSPIVGREHELAAARALILREDAGLVTFTGPAGTGKTRLGLQVAHELLAEFEDGVFFIPLASVTDPQLVPLVIAQALAIRETAGRSAMENLQDYLRQKHLMVVLDNFEQLVSASDMVVSLLSSCPGLKLLVTSRRPLRVREEKEFPVPPLSLPHPKLHLTAESLSQYEAVELFIQRALDVKPDFKVTNANAPAVAEICHRLDGLPLAIELAAARINILSPQMMLARLQNADFGSRSGESSSGASRSQEGRLKLLTGGPRDLPARQQTMRATLAWSYDLLEEQEKVLFRRLSVFVGGCTLEAAEAVVGGSGEPTTGNRLPTTTDIDILNGLGSLVDKSLLLQTEQWDGDPRFKLLETIREYGLEKLSESGEEEAMCRSHALYFLSLAEEGEAALQGPDQELWLNRLETEHDNLRAALQWCLSSVVSGQSSVAGNAGELTTDEIGVRMGGALWRFWYMRSYFTEGRKWLGELLALPGAQGHTAESAKVLNGAGNLAYSQGDYDAAAALHTEGMEISRELGDKQAVGASLNNLALVYRLRGDYAAARSRLEEALQINRELGNVRWQALNLNNLGNVLHDQSELAKARVMQEESLALFTRLGDRWGIAMALRDLGSIVSAQGDYPAARDLYERSMALQADVGDRREVGLTLIQLGLVAWNQGDYVTARSFYQEGQAVMRDLGDKRGIATTLEGLANIASYQGNYAEARLLYEESLAIREEVGYRRGIGSANNNLGLVSLRQGDYRRAESLFERSLSVWRDLGDKGNVSIVLNNLGRALMGKGDFDRAEAVFKEALVMSQEAGNKWATSYSISGLGQLALRREQLDEAHRLLKESLTMRRELGDRWSIARSLAAMAALADARGDPERVATLLGAAEAQMEAMGVRLEPMHRAEHERAIIAARAQLGDEWFDTAWNWGRGLSIEQAAEYALQS